MRSLRRRGRSRTERGVQHEPRARLFAGIAADHVDEGQDGNGKQNGFIFRGKKRLRLRSITRHAVGIDRFRYDVTFDYGPAHWGYAGHSWLIVAVTMAIFDAYRAALREAVAPYLKVMACPGWLRAAERHRADESNDERRADDAALPL